MSPYESANRVVKMGHFKRYSELIIGVRTIMSRFAVFGSPIAHSLSPQIHQDFAKQTDIVLTFERILTGAGELKAALNQFTQNAGKGACVTLPLKMEAYALCDHVTDAARNAGAVNTLYWDQGLLWGDNTDGEGFIRDLTHNLGFDLKGKRILILGAGGAARGILKPILAQEVQAIVIVNRTLEKAQSLCTSNVSAYSYITFDNANQAPFDLVINATSMSLQDALPQIAPKWIKGTIAMDLAYRQNQDTVFQQWATTHGAIQTVDGIGMLVEQAALGFNRWHHILPATQAIIQKLRQRQG